MRSSGLLALAASFSTSAAVYKGFNYGATQSDDSIKVQSDFQSEFQTAKDLVGTSGFTSARLYTMIQGSSGSSPTEAIPAAIAEDTSLLLGLWASGGNMANEIAALTAAISEYGTDLANLVVGISVGSEDLYRDSVTGIEADAGVGAGPATIVSYISQVRTAIADTVLKDVLVGHVDTWTAWVNSSNDAVIDACDFIGLDAYPYFQNTEENSISVSYSLFQSAWDVTVAAAGGKDVWITETGWPVSGSTEGDGVPSLQNAQTYWDEVGCGFAFDKINTWWYTLQDADPVTPNPSFGIVGSTLSDTPLFNLTCPSVSTISTSSAVSSSTATTTESGSATAVVSSGSGLSPSQAVPYGSGNGATTTATASGSTSGTSGSSNGTTSGKTSATGSKTSSSSTSSSSASPISANGASTLTGSAACLFVAVFAMVAAL